MLLLLSCSKRCGRGSKGRGAGSRCRCWDGLRQLLQRLLHALLLLLLLVLHQRLLLLGKAGLLLLLLQGHHLPLHLWQAGLHALHPWIPLLLLLPLQLLQWLRHTRLGQPLLQQMLWWWQRPLP
jgi:hypothetical protein